jgi:hypothetical protein
MRYWLAEYPQSPESFAYDAATYQADLDYLTALISEIAARAAASRSETGPGAASGFDEVWPLTDDWGQCRFCNYRSLCDRGDIAGPSAEYMQGDADELASGDIDLKLDLDWGQVQEIVY